MPFRVFLLFCVFVLKVRFWMCFFSYAAVFSNSTKNQLFLHRLVYSHGESLQLHKILTLIECANLNEKVSGDKIFIFLLVDLLFC